jgi:hypothetical protein
MKRLLPLAAAFLFFAFAGQALSQPAFDKSDAFRPTGATVAVTGGNSAAGTAVALSASGPEEIIYNSGTVGAWVTFGGSSASAAVGTTIFIAGGQSEEVYSGVQTYVDAYGVGGTPVLYVTPGIGLASGWGASGGSVSAAVTAASGAFAAGAIVDLTNVETTAGGSAPSKAISIQGIAGGTPIIDSLAQINGTTILTGAGATGAGSQRTTVAQDNTTIAGSPNTTILNNNPNATANSPDSVAATVATGNTFQQVFAANSTRTQCRIFNPVSATETLLVFDGTSAATANASIGLGPGAGYFCAGNGTVNRNAIFVTAATTGHAFSDAGS